MACDQRQFTRVGKGAQAPYAAAGRARLAQWHRRLWPHDRCGSFFDRARRSGLAPDFRYSLLATKIVWRRNMSLRAQDHRLITPDEQVS